MTALEPDDASFAYLVAPTVQLSNQFYVDLQGLYELKPLLTEVFTENFRLFSLIKEKISPCGIEPVILVN
jgi:hypothetical protein